MGSHRTALRPDADLSPPGFARLIGELLDALDLNDVTLVGNDSGGGMSQVFAAQGHPRLGRLVLTDCDAFENFPPKLFVPLKWLARGPRSVAAVLAPLRSARARRLPFAYGWTAKHGVPDELSAAWCAPALRDAGVRRDIAKLLAGMDGRHTLASAAALRRFDRPALVVWSPEDRFFPIAHGRRLAELLPQGRFEQVDDSWAFVPLDQPQRLAELIADFLAQGASAPASASLSDR